MPVDFNFFSVLSFHVRYLFWWSQAGSNRRPPACKAGALPAELWPHGSRSSNSLKNSLESADLVDPAKGHEASTHSARIDLREAMVGLGGLEPPASPLSGVRSNHLSYRPMEVEPQNLDQPAPNSHPKPLFVKSPPMDGRP